MMGGSKSVFLTNRSETGRPKNLRIQNTEKKIRYKKYSRTCGVFLGGHSAGHLAGSQLLVQPFNLLQGGGLGNSRLDTPHLKQKNIKITPVQ
jgi:hypothetical protein